MRPPKGTIPVLLVLTVISWIPLAFLLQAHATKSDKPRISFIPDMDKQLKFTAQKANPLFADGRAMRPPVAGTVARGELRADTAYYQGTSGEDFIDSIPVPVTPSLMKRGQERYNIFCAPCHGLVGNGDGMVHQRALELEQGTWIQPTNLNAGDVLTRPDGHLFNTITHGIRNMPPYGSQIDVHDRWAVVAYVRALQRSRNAQIEDVPEDIRPSLR